jgi:ABC-type multidrug transport system ATPase subunit
LPRIKSNVDVASGGSIDSSVVKVEVHKSVLPGTQAQEMRLMMVHHAMETEEQDNRDLLMKMRARLDAVNLRMPAAEVRFKNLSADAHVNVGSAGMPTFINFFRESIVDLLSAAHLTSGGKEPLSILNNVSGVLKPGKFTLLLGPPAGGKTTFLKALSGAGGAGGISIKGEILYNGEPLSDFQPRRTSAYVDEIDLHQAEFTVRETFDMAARCLGAGHMPAYSAELRKREEEIGIHPDPVVAAMMDAMSLEGHKHSIMTDLTLRILGLEVCSETQIGNEMIRGVSGGQKKRVTTGELLVGPARVLLMDSISTGLDSSTTHLIISCLRNICHLLDTTVCVSLLQPPPEVFDLFDDVMVLSEGYLIYHGPKEEIPGFFNSLGFQIPERKEVADFLQEITSRKDQGQYRIDQSKKDEFVPVKEIYNAFQKSSMGQAMAVDLATPALPPPLAVTSDGNKSKVLAPFATDPLVRKRYALGNWQVFRAMADRDSLLFSRNSFLYIFQEFQTCLVGAMATTLFLKVNYTKSTFQDGQVYLGLLFFCAMTAMWNVFAEMGTMCFSLPVFFKQRSMQLYPAWAFTLPAAVMRLPFSLLDATLFSCIMYFPTGLALQPSKFFIFWTFHILFSQVGVTMFRFVGALGRTFEVANSYGNLVVILQMILSGFVMSKALIPNWWVWMYWASPLTYAQQAYFLNEFTSSDWATIVEYNGQNVTLGNAVLMSHQLWTNPNMIWVSALVLIGYWFLFNALTALVLSYTPSPGPAVPSFSKAFLQRRILNVNGGELSDAHRSSIELNDHSAAKMGTQVVAEGGKGVTMPFSPASVCFHGIKYTVPMPAGAGKEGEKDLVILSDITGSFRPGVLTALMGVSGAGKTTLMDVLAGRKTVGVITGDIKVNGHKKNQAHFASIAGYVEQTDIHMPRTTVREAVQISGLLRLHNTSKDQIELFVDEVMSLVELTPLAKSIVGAPGQFGLSVEQRKRLTIAVELVANPSIIFMDEPTSGLVSCSNVL